MIGPAALFMHVSVNIIWFIEFVLSWVAVTVSRVSGTEGMGYDFLTLGHSLAFSCFFPSLQNYWCITVHPQPNWSKQHNSPGVLTVADPTDIVFPNKTRYSCTYGNIQAHLHNNADNSKMLDKVFKREHINNRGLMYTSLKKPAFPLQEEENFKTKTHCTAWWQFNAKRAHRFTWHWHSNSARYIKHAGLLAWCQLRQNTPHCPAAFFISQKRREQLINPWQLRRKKKKKKTTSLIPQEVSPKAVICNLL